MEYSSGNGDEGGFPDGSVVKNPPANARDLGSIPGSGRTPKEGNGNPLQYSCLGNPMDRGGWWATVHGVAKSGTAEHTHAHQMGMKKTGKKHVKELARFWVTDFWGTSREKETKENLVSGVNWASIDTIL